MEGEGTDCLGRRLVPLWRLCGLLFGLGAEGYAHLLGNANGDDAERSGSIGMGTRCCGIRCCGGRVARYWCLMLRRVASFMRAHQQRMLRARAWFSTNHMSTSSAAPGGLAFKSPLTHLLHSCFGGNQSWLTVIGYSSVRLFVCSRGSVMFCHGPLRSSSSTTRRTGQLLHITTRSPPSRSRNKFLVNKAR